LWGTDNGRDWLGDDLPPEEVNVIREGEHYGWPYRYGQNRPDPKYGDRAPATLSFVPPAFELPAHWAPLGLGFYSGNQFPGDYRGDLFVACHGSWNSSVRVGYKVIRITMENGLPVRFHDFVTGFLGSGAKVLGRPVDVVAGPRGALFVSDDYRGVIYRIVYPGK
ncbi:MAG: PQQ-dependent sugar dehydrogenase, partial [Fidelibacterota bacterium]